MLDYTSDTRSELRPKRTTAPGQASDSNRHLTYEDLEAYVSGRLAPARLKDCGTHLDACDACRAELEDLRSFKSESAAFPRPETSRREPGRTRRRKSTLPYVAACATLFVAAGAAVVWWVRERPRTNNTAAVAMTATRSPTPSPAPAVPAHNPQANAEKTERVADHAAPGNREAPKPASGFALLEPVGQTIADPRPEFRWQPLAGAVRYRVRIVDLRLHPVQRSPALRTTTWRPRRPLRPGKTYLWQVTAVLRGGSTMVASGEPATAIVAPETPGGHSR